MKHVAPTPSSGCTTGMPLSALMKGMFHVMALLGVDALRQPVGHAKNHVASKRWRSSHLTTLVANATNSSKPPTAGGMVPQKKFNQSACAKGGCLRKNISTKSNDLQVKMRAPSLVHSIAQ